MRKSLQLIFAEWIFQHHQQQELSAGETHMYRVNLVFCMKKHKRRDVMYVNV